LDQICNVDGNFVNGLLLFSPLILKNEWIYFSITVS
jgi:hypothetical protein